MRIYIAKSTGLHNSLALPRRTETFTAWYQVTTGEWKWYAHDQASAWGAFRALFLPTASSFDIREILIAPGADDFQVLQREIIHLGELIPLTVEQSKLDPFLDRLIAFHANSTSERARNENLKLELVKLPDRRYTIFSTCNHDVARWLRELGCSVGYVSPVGNFRVEQNKS